MKRKVGKRKRKRRDLISDLPISILHRILSFLSDKDLATTYLLSKQWNFTRKSFPVLVFDEPFSRVISTDKQRLRKYVDYVVRSLHNFIQHKLCLDRVSFSLYVKGLNFLPLIGKWLPLALHSGALDISFSVGINKYHFPETTFSVNSLLLCDSSQFFRLQKLMLHDVILSENIVRDINRNCPNLAFLDIYFFNGLKAFNISKPNKLVHLNLSFSEEIVNVSVDSLSLKHFAFELDGGPCNRGVIDLTSCCNLRELALRNVVITDAIFNLHISKFIFLEVLDISSCDLLRRIRISLQRLKHLQLFDCSAIEAIEIDAPYLSKFDFTPDGGILPELVSRNIIHGSMQIWYIMDFMHGQVNNDWFIEIREYLTRVPFDSIIFGALCCCKQIDFAHEVSFNIEELREDAIPPLLEIDCLDLTGVYINDSSYRVTLLEGLLWSCHPKTIRMNAYANSNDENDCRQLFCTTMMQSGCLKVEEIESVAGIVLDIDNLEEFLRKQNPYVDRIISSIPKHSTKVFGLEWDYSAIQ